MEKFFNLQSMCWTYNSFEEALKDLVFYDADERERDFKWLAHLLQKKIPLVFDSSDGLPENTSCYIYWYTETRDWFLESREGIVCQVNKNTPTGQSVCFFEIPKPKEEEEKEKEDE